MNITTLKTAAIALLAFTSTAVGQNAGDIVETAMNELMVNKNATVIDQYFSEPYVQHNQSVPTGLVAFKGLADQAIAKNPAFKYNMVRFFSDGDFGIAHGIYNGFGPVPMVGFDVFRVENGKIVEHWDNLAPIAEPNPSGHSQTDGPTEVSNLKQTEQNKAMVTEFVNEVLVKGAFDQLPNYFDGNSYIQHNSNIADGLDGLSAGLASMAEAGLSLRISKIHHVFGQGNFVLALSEGDISGAPTAFYDLFRVENDKIAEHWDVISPIVPDADAANKIGKF